MKLKIKKLNENVNIPEYKSEGAAGMDLYANINQRGQQVWIYMLI